MAIRVVLVDDHPLVLGGLEQLLRAEPDFEVLAACGTVADAWEAIAAHKDGYTPFGARLTGRAAARQSVRPP